jgi:hypothetical protein
MPKLERVELTEKFFLNKNQDQKDFYLKKALSSIFFKKTRVGFLMK